MACQSIMQPFDKHIAYIFHVLSAIKLGVFLFLYRCVIFAHRSFLSYLKSSLWSVRSAGNIVIMAPRLRVSLLRSIFKPLTLKHFSTSVQVRLVTLPTHPSRTISPKALNPRGTKEHASQTIEVQVSLSTANFMLESLLRSLVNISRGRHR